MRLANVGATKGVFVSLVVFGAWCSSGSTRQTVSLDAESAATLTDPDSLALAAVEWRSLALADTSITPIRSGAVLRLGQSGLRDLPLKALLADTTIWRVPADSDLSRRYGFHARFTRQGGPNVDVLAGEDIVAVARDGKILIVAGVSFVRAFNGVPMHVVSYIE
jgi:hypothetical protein